MTVNSVGRSPSPESDSAPLPSLQVYDSKMIPAIGGSAYNLSFNPVRGTLKKRQLGGTSCVRAM
jgi:hypothetical protein